MKAIRNNEVIAESAEAVKEQGYYYFPVERVRTAFTKPSRDASGCYLKGRRIVSILRSGPTLCKRRLAILLPERCGGIYQNIKSLSFGFL